MLPESARALEFTIVGKSPSSLPHKLTLDVTILDGLLDEFCSDEAFVEVATCASHFSMNAVFCWVLEKKISAHVLHEAKWWGQAPSQNDFDI